MVYLCFCHFPKVLVCYPGNFSEEKILIEQWRKEYNQVWPPAPEARMLITLTKGGILCGGKSLMAIEFYHCLDRKSRSIIR